MAKDNAPKADKAPKDSKSAKEPKAPKAAKTPKGEKAPTGAAAASAGVARLHAIYRDKIAPDLIKKFGYKSAMQVPRLTKITLNMGVSEAVTTGFWPAILVRSLTAWSMTFLSATASLTPKIGRAHV